MWKCKHCGGTNFQEKVVGGYEIYSGYGKDGYPFRLEESDYETDTECIKCGFIGSGIAQIAEWEEEDE